MPATSGSWPSTATAASAPPAPTRRAAPSETVWLPSGHVETSTLAVHRSYLDKHSIPACKDRPAVNILPLRHAALGQHRPRPCHTAIQRGPAAEGISALVGCRVEPYDVGAAHRFSTSLGSLKDEAGPRQLPRSTRVSASRLIPCLPTTGRRGRRRPAGGRRRRAQVAADAA